MQSICIYVLMLDEFINDLSLCQLKDNKHKLSYYLMLYQDNRDISERIIELLDKIYLKLDLDILHGFNTKTYYQLPKCDYHIIWNIGCPLCRSYMGKKQCRALFNGCVLCRKCKRKKYSLPGRDCESCEEYNSDDFIDRLINK